jgi:protein-L-isoaspartate(D-aspartate) O-methyltransferase
MSFAAARANMVESQLRPNGITDQRIVAAMGAVAREAFVPPGLESVAYMDEDLPLSKGRALMEPMAFARLVQLAEITTQDRVLHVGCATGYGTAVLARLCGSVAAREDDPALAAQAKAVLAKLGIANAVIGDGAGQFDVVLVEGRLPSRPDGLLAQLDDGGRLVAVVGADSVAPAMLFTKHHGGISARAAFDASVPALPDHAPAAPAAFVF